MLGISRTRVAKLLTPHLGSGLSNFGPQLAASTMFMAIAIWSAPAHHWNGSVLSFQNPDGTWGNGIDLKGEQGLQGEIGPVGNSVNLRLDSDGDGFADWIEVALSTDPDDGANQPTDANLNGIADSFEVSQCPRDFCLLTHQMLLPTFHCRT